MMKNAPTLLHVCLALLVASAACGQKAAVNNSSAGGATVTTNATQTGREPLSAQQQAGAPASSPAATVSVRLKQVEINMDMIDAPVEGMTVGLRAGDKTFSKVTGGDGVVVFDAVPCGGEVSVTARPFGGEEDTTLRRRLDCQAGTVDLGLIVSAFSGPPTLEQREAREMLYDANAGVWRSGDEIVPDEQVEKILSKYQSGK